MASLDHVISQLKDNKKSTEDVEAAVMQLNRSFNLFLNREKTGKMKALESAREAGNNAMQATKNKLAPGSMLGGLGGLGKAGMLAGLGGLAAVATGLLDADKLKKNVETILSIGDRYESGGLEKFAADGAIVVGLGMLGKALVAFAIGSGATAATQKAMEYWGKDDWATTLKDNVTTILGIGDSIQNIPDAAKAALLPIYFKSLAAGLLAFSAAEGAAGIADAVNEWVAFPGGWANGVKNDVEALLSINLGQTTGDQLKSLAKALVGLPAIMAGLSAGLIAFSVGESAAGIGDAIHNWVGFGEGWAQRVVDDITALLSIGQLQNVNVENVAKVFGSLSAIGAGLAAFGLGSAVAGAGQAAAQFTMTDVRNGVKMLLGESTEEGGASLGEGWAEKTVKNVKELLKIADIPFKDTTKFAATMTGIAAGLAVFGVGAAITGTGQTIADAMSGISMLMNGNENVGADWVQKTVTSINSLMAIDFTNADTFKTGMASVAAGLVALFAAQGLGTIQSGIDTVVGAFRKLFGMDEGESTDPFDRIVTGINKINALPAGSLDNLKAFGTALDDFFVSFKRIGDQDIGQGFSKNVAEMVEQIGFTLNALPNLLEGGKLTDGTDNWLSRTLGTGRGEIADFGKGLRRLREEDLDDLAAGVAALQSALFPMQPMEPIPTTGGGGGGGNTVVSADDNSVTQTQVNPMSFPGNTDTVNPNDPNLKPSRRDGRK